MALELGDHIWYWNGKISLESNIPRSDWFPDSNPNDPNDYMGHGREIYYYVIYPDEIARGQPQLKSGPGSFSWLNNNPGNLTGVAGGPDFGQYPGKFSWHNFLIFPSWDVGFAAIAQFLRAPAYASLSILQAFSKYAPAGDGGNDPALYASSVAQALGLPDSTIMSDLDDDQMMVMQSKIQEIEGAIPGESLAWDSADIPPEIAELLPPG